MALDKVVDSAALDAEMTSVANAIRAKTGNTDMLAWPDGFLAAIAEITGGATEPYIEEVIDGNGNLINATLHGHTIISNSAFENCTMLALTSLSPGLTRIGNRAFYNCSELTLTSLPAGLTSIGGSAFANCSKLALTSLPAGLTSIGGSAFKDCLELALTSLPSGLTSIENNAF